MVGLVAYLRRIIDRRSKRSHRTTTVTRTVIREADSPEVQRVEQKVVKEEEIPVEVSPAEKIAHITIAATSVAGVVAAAFLLGWMLRKARATL